MGLRGRRADVAARRARAISLRAQGQTWEQIAQELGYRTRGAACQDVARALKSRAKDEIANAEQLRELELERLDALQRKVWEVLDKPHLLVQGGRVVTVEAPDGREIKLQDDGPTLAAVDRLLRITERRTRLLGLNARGDAAGDSDDDTIAFLLSIQTPRRPEVRPAAES